MYRTLLLLAPAVCLLSQPSHGAEWKFDPTVQLKAGYNDNINLTPDNEVDSTEITLTPSAQFGVETPRSGLSGVARFDFRRFPQESNLDDNNARLGIRSFYAMDRSRVGLDADLIKDTTLDSQLDETGLVLDRTDRLERSLSPNFTWMFGERSRLEASYTLRDVNYDDSADGFSDFTSHSGQLSLVRTLSERTSASITAGHRFTDSSNNIESLFSYLQGGASIRFSETLSVSLSAGIRRTETRFPEVIPIFFGPFFLGTVDTGRTTERSEWGSVFGASIDKQFERGQATLSTSRNVDNTVSGIQVEVFQVNGRYLRHFSPTLSGALDLGWYDSQSTDAGSRAFNRRYWTVEPHLDWDFAQFWRLSATYRLREQEFESSGDNATQNSAYLTLTYRWPRIAISR